MRTRFSALFLTLAVVVLFLGTILVLQWQQMPATTPETASAVEPLTACESYTSRTADLLIPTPEAGEAYFTQFVPTRAEPKLPDVLPLAAPYSLRWRTGAAVAHGNPFSYDWPTPRPGWYLNWNAQPLAAAYSPAQLGMEFTPMVRLTPDGLKPSLAAIAAIATARPGSVWLIGNEPDVRWQDDATPEEYACTYHHTYETIKAADPTAQVAIGGVSQITPLRLAYLDRVLASYAAQFARPMPVDVWNMHAFVLREEADNWGVGTPPGFEDVEHGVLWEIAQHDNLILVENQVRLMRRWMAHQGERDKPLYITEYGILMPAEYGFDPYRVIEFMVGSFDLFTRLRDAETGYPADDNRLVQRWNWFSTRDHLYPSGDLFDSNGAPLPLMRAMSGYIRAHESEATEGSR